MRTPNTHIAVQNVEAQLSAMTLNVPSAVIGLKTLQMCQK